MPLFRYQAYERDGGEVSGLIEADDVAAARQLVKSRGLAPFAIEPAADEQTGSFGAGQFSLVEQARLAVSCQPSLRAVFP